MTELKIYSPLEIMPIISNNMVVEWGFNENNDILVDVKTKHAARIKRDLKAMGYEMF